MTEPSSTLEIGYDEALPITAWHDEIADAIRDHPVVVVAGETGSGKTTQLTEDLPRARPALDRTYSAAPESPPVQSPNGWRKN